jgi:hypothetical protein
MHIRTPPPGAGATRQSSATPAGHVHLDFAGPLFVAFENGNDLLSRLS